MKRAKLGDVYWVKVPNGYKIYQWAYSIPRKGDYIRVFDGLYDSIPTEITAIVAGPHSYIIPFYSSKAYRIGLAHLIGNYPVPAEYPFPEFQISFCRDVTGIYKIEVMRTNFIPGNAEDAFQVFKVSRMADLPPIYQKLTLLNSCVTPNWLLYLFDINFSLSALETFYPGRYV